MRPQPRARHPATRSSGFTLFEVIISMLVVTIAILATVALLPIGLRAQQVARYKLFAGSTALTLMEDFHNPLIGFRGHGPLAPAMAGNLADPGGSTNLGTSPNYAAPPIPGWANRLRDTNLDVSAYQHDIERYLCGWVQGVAPVPLEIARRLDSDGDAIQRHLDQGGYLFYLLPGFVRGLTSEVARDRAQTYNESPESQKLVFAVTGNAQQNALTSHPLESWPWYELYPFPPAWVALKASGYEIRRGPVDRTIHSVDAKGNDVWSMIQGQDMNGQPQELYNDSDGNPSSGIVWGDGGHSGWAPVTFPRAPMNRTQLSPPLSTLGAKGPTDQTINPIDPEDQPLVPADPPKGGSLGWYQGRNWRYFKTAMPTSPWADGWLAFQKLAGFNDSYRDKAWKDYADYGTVPREQHYERAGWLPVMAMLVNDDNARYDAYWYEIVPDPAAGAGKQAYRGGTSLGSDAGTGAFPPKPAWYKAAWNKSPWLNQSYNVHTGAPDSLLMPTYEMRADYRDKAISLWYAVAAGVPGFGTPPARGAPGQTPALAEIADTQVDCDAYEYGPAALQSFIAAAEPLLDPHALPAGSFPPHPAQVLALSYLAHASMMMTGWDAPFFVSEMHHFLDWDCLTWHYRSNKADGTPEVDGDGNAVHYAKDAKILLQVPGNLLPAGTSAFDIGNDTPATTPIVLYKGDIICFEEDYRAWVAYTKPKPGFPVPNHGVPKYRVTENTVIAPAAGGVLHIEPPLIHDYHVLVIDRPADDTATPKITEINHQQQFIRVCNDYDRAFARTVHELCMRWAACYCSENPYDWGAPRMMNHQVMNDKPLAMLDLFEDAAKGPGSSGSAQRVPQNLPTASTVSPQESFYRWIQTPNTAPRGWFRQDGPGSVPSSGPVCAISHLGPARRAQSAWQSLAYNAELAPPSTAAPSGKWDWSSDANRYWLNRPFQPFHRGRRLEFWAADWQSYEDAETAPSAPLDLAKHARVIRLKPDGTTVDMFFPMLLGNATIGGDSQYAGNPENGLLWSDVDRKRRFSDGATASNVTSLWSYTTDSNDVVMGHWGADRNNNRVLDIGKVPRSARMRAVSLARFNVYDPVMRLHTGD